MQKIILFILLSLLSGLLFVSCMDTNTANPDSWVGNYAYEEEPVKANAGYAMVMEWTLAIKKQKDTCIGIVEINGQQTYLKLSTIISGDSNKIAIVYNKVIDDVDENFKHGDTLFMLSKKENKIITEWQKIAPRLSSSYSKTCNCFTAMANK